MSLLPVCYIMPPYLIILGVIVAATSTATVAATARQTAAELAIVIED